MKKRQPPPTENKLLLLYSIDKLSPITKSQLIRFVAENELMPYMELMLLLGELQQSGLLLVSAQGEDSRIASCARGKQTLDLFARRIPASRREAVDSVYDHWKELFRHEQQVVAIFSREPDGDYMVHLRVHEGQEDIFSIALRVSEKEQAALLCENFRNSADEVYRGLIASLLATPKG